MSYPPANPTNTWTNASPVHDLHPGAHNEVANAIRDIIAELGTNPSGSSATLTDRLAALAAANLRYMGNWSALTQYEDGDIVTYLGSSWILDGTLPVGTPPDVEAMDVAVVAGPVGPTGIQGATGPIGLAGPPGAPSVTDGYQRAVTSSPGAGSTPGVTPTGQTYVNIDGAGGVAIYAAGKTRQTVVPATQTAVRNSVVVPHGFTTRRVSSVIKVGVNVNHGIMLSWATGYTVQAYIFIFNNVGGLYQVQLDSNLPAPALVKQVINPVAIVAGQVLELTAVLERYKVTVYVNDVEHLRYDLDVNQFGLLAGAPNSGLLGFAGWAGASPGLDNGLSEWRTLEIGEARGILSFDELEDVQVAAIDGAVPRFDASVMRWVSTDVPAGAPALSNTTPLAPSVDGSPGGNAAAARSQHQHPFGDVMRLITNDPFVVPVNYDVDTGERSPWATVHLADPGPDPAFSLVGAMQALYGLNIIAHAGYVYGFSYGIEGKPYPFVTIGSGEAIEWSHGDTPAIGIMELASENISTGYSDGFMFTAGGGGDHFRPHMAIMTLNTDRSASPNKKFGPLLKLKDGSDSKAMAWFAASGMLSLIGVGGEADDTAVSINPKLTAYGDKILLTRIDSGSTKRQAIGSGSEGMRLAATRMSFRTPVAAGAEATSGAEMAAIGVHAGVVGGTTSQGLFLANGPTPVSVSGGGVLSVVAGALVYRGATTTTVLAPT